MTIEFTIPGVPQGKERPRFTQNGATYTPKKTKDYEKLVAWAYQCEAHGAKFTGTIRVDIAAIYPVPHSWSKRKQAEAIDNQILPMVKPDWDNIGKIVCDALNGIAYKDDAVITDATVCKRYEDCTRDACKKIDRNSERGRQVRGMGENHHRAGRI